MLMTVHLYLRYQGLTRFFAIRSETKALVKPLFFHGPLPNNFASMQ